MCSDGDTLEARVTEVYSQNGSIDAESSRYDATESRQEPDSHLTGTTSTFASVLSGSASIRHSASDSLVYSTDVELAASCDAQQTAQVTSSAGVNGCCKPAEETSLPQVNH